MSSRRDETWMDGLELDRYDWKNDKTMTEPARMFCDAFVKEYMKDYNGAAAMARCGSTAENLYMVATKMLKKPYVQARLDELVRKISPADVVTRQQVLSRMWALANDPCNDGKTKVAATAHCAKMLGMMGEKEDTTPKPFGVMFIPIMSNDDWQQSATTAQALLKRQAMSAMDCPPPQPTHAKN